MYVLRDIAEYAYSIIRLLLLMFILFIVVRFLDERRRRVKNAFDERQIQCRLKAYRLAFFSMLIVSVAALQLYRLWDHFRFFLPSLFVLIIAVGVCCFTVYAVFSDAYVSARDSSDRKLAAVIILVLISLVSFLVSLVAIRSETDEILTFWTILRTSASIDLILLLMFTVITSALLIKHIKDRREG